ncbi:MAG TPA: twin-arginine translocase TatA/TatE family subunit [Cyclobacteriaceae bacterium]|nr:twin-arginine translocase TatA/TatE family subunit [Cyclobacteriaceae bacterium]
MKAILLWTLGGWEIAIIVLFILIFFGAKRIPELARGLGRGIREFKDAARDIRNDIDEAGKSTNSGKIEGGESKNTNS